MASAAEIILRIKQMEIAEQQRQADVLTGGIKTAFRGINRGIERGAKEKQQKETLAAIQEFSKSEREAGQEFSANQGAQNREAAANIAVGNRGFAALESDANRKLRREMGLLSDENAKEGLRLQAETNARLEGMPERLAAIRGQEMERRFDIDSDMFKIRAQEQATQDLGRENRKGVSDTIDFNRRLRARADELTRKFMHERKMKSAVEITRFTAKLVGKGAISEGAFRAALAIKADHDKGEGKRALKKLDPQSLIDSENIIKAYLKDQGIIATDGKIKIGDLKDIIGVLRGRF